MISVKQQFAEKLHAYTLPRQGINTRVKDLLDMILLARIRTFNLTTLKEALGLVFKIRNTHSLPFTINPPPAEWQLPFDKLARECALSLSLDNAFEETASIYNKVHL